MNYRLIAEARVAQDLLAARRFYEQQQSGLGDEFLMEVSSTYDRVLENPMKYRVLRSEIRRALCKRFPYSIFFAVEDETIIVLAVLHSARDPEEWYSLQ